MVQPLRHYMSCPDASLPHQTTISTLSHRHPACKFRPNRSAFFCSIFAQPRKSLSQTKHESTVTTVTQEGNRTGTRVFSCVHRNHSTLLSVSSSPRSFQTHAPLRSATLRTPRLCLHSLGPRANTHHGRAGLQTNAHLRCRHHPRS